MGVQVVLAKRLAMVGCDHDQRRVENAASLQHFKKYADLFIKVSDTIIICVTCQDLVARGEFLLVERAPFHNDVEVILPGPGVHAEARAGFGWQEVGRVRIEVVEEHEERAIRLRPLVEPAEKIAIDARCAFALGGEKPVAHVGPELMDQTKVERQREMAEGFEGRIEEACATQDAQAREDVIFKVGESTTQSRFIRTITGVGDEAGGRIGVIFEVFGEGQEMALDRDQPVDAQLMRPAAREETGMRGERPGGRCAGLLEANSPRRQAVEGRRGRAVVAISAQVVGPHGVEHDKEDVGRAGRGHGTTRFMPLFDGIAQLDRSGRKHRHHHQNRQRTHQPSPPARGISFEQGDDLKRHAQAEHEPGLDVDSLTGDRQSGKEDAGDQDPRAEPAGAARPEAHRR